jgi:hypothetical protein
MNLINWQKQVLKINLKDINQPLASWKVIKQAIRTDEPFTTNGQKHSTYCLQESSVEKKKKLGY